ncbi:protein GAST1-like [Amaranthus tricolor]|uniref:protein GAST1-like n=1 Tax=Amaranthus tricolor TaxID=29722 RepID=UPI0025870521|nr:protein GAST1-like [Amaranthus tricolor]
MVAIKLLFLIFFFVIALPFSPAETTHMHKGHAQPPVPAPLASYTIPSYGYTPGSLEPQECGERCEYRCSNTQYRKPCLFFCNKCCAKCLCVPAGTYGNKQSCPCYNNWKTKRGGPKCP